MGLDRRRFLVTAAASGAMAKPAAAQGTGAAPVRPSSRSAAARQEGRAVGQGEFSKERLGKMHEVTDSESEQCQPGTALPQDLPSR